MGNPIQKLNEKVSLVASENTWIEGLAIQQLNKTAELEGMHAVAGMPDLHPGKGYPIGAAFFSKEMVYPALVGNDIGCGMGLWQTSLKTNKVNLDKLSKRLSNVESPLDDSWQDYIFKRKSDKCIANSMFDISLGTIGGGNHFAEFQQVVEVMDQAKLETLGLNPKQIQLLVHSGSRGLGQSILVNHVQIHSHNGVSDNSEAQKKYLVSHDEAVRWAELNRELIAKRFMQATRLNGECLMDVNHNLVMPMTFDGVPGWLHRKGATPSDAGFVMIPGSRGDYSYLVQPTSSEKALFSLAHGAGRKWKRGDCKDRLSRKYKREDLYRTDLGSRVICGDKELLYDEAPQAYKDCSSIIDDLVNAELIEVVAKLKPVLTFKTMGTCHG
ncbi:MAG: RNA ligase RtcB family protein [Aestuariibacter sp.]